MNLPFYSIKFFPVFPIIHSAAAELQCGEHRCISGQAALKASTLRRHYYPEGDWGWVVVLVGLLSTVLNHGVQLSGPLYLLPAGERFKQSVVNSAGECGFSIPGLPGLGFHITDAILSRKIFQLQLKTDAVDGR